MFLRISICLTGLVLLGAGCGKPSVQDIMLKELLQRLRSEDENDRYQGIIQLGTLGDKRAIPELMKLLKNEDSSLKRPVIEALCNLNAKEAAPEIVKLMFDNKAWWLVEESSKALVKLNAKEVIPDLMRMLDVKEYHTTVYLSNDMCLGDIDAKGLHGLVAITLVELGAKDRLTKENIEDIKYLSESPVFYLRGNHRPKDVLKELGVEVPEKKK
jgi:hypothetical protein